MASKFSSEKPSGLTIAWHVWHADGFVCKATRWRVVIPAWRSAGIGVIASGGGRSVLPSTLLARKTPRWIGELPVL